jgi:O-antigen/teichoic acid export membrane protein
MDRNNTLQAFWIGLGSLSSFFLSILSAMILSRYFNKTDYGTYKQIIFVYSSLLVIFSAGLPTVFSYFLPNLTLAKGKEIVLKISIILFILGALFSIFLYFSSDFIGNALRNADLSQALKVFSPIPLFLLPTLGIDGIFSTYQKTFYSALYNIITRMVMLVFIVAPVIFIKNSLNYSIYGWIIASFISFVVAIYFKQIPFKGIEIENANISYKEIFAYCIPLVTASIWGVAIKSSDQFYISRFFGAESFAEFSNGFIEIPFVYMITTASATIMLPLFSKMVYEKSNIEDFVTLWKNAIKKSAILIYPIVMFCLFNASNIITTLYSNYYSESTIYFQIALLINLFNIIIFAPFILALGKTKFYSNLHFIIALLAWGLGYLCVVLFKSPISIAILSIVLSVIKVLVALLFVSNYINVKVKKLIPLKDISIYILHSALSALFVKIILTYFFNSFENIFNLIISLTLYFIILIISSIPLKINYLSIIHPLFIKTKKNVKQI